jgi:hypothetical protein
MKNILNILKRLWNSITIASASIGLVFLLIGVFAFLSGAGEEVDFILVALACNFILVFQCFFIWVITGKVELFYRNINS